MLTIFVVKTTKQMLNECNLSDKIILDIKEQQNDN